ncbi:hypothetical protein PQQ51_00975 [Paraburkholderia xenovorans]|uniref:hypothetical protein n=1 Tax=Paraburkholderia xenovorans TaxID=36873 RepID=UPI0038B9EBDD
MPSSIRSISPPPVTHATQPDGGPLETAPTADVGRSSRGRSEAASMQFSTLKSRRSGESPDARSGESKTASSRRRTGALPTDHRSVSPDAAHVLGSGQSMEMTNLSRTNSTAASQVSKVSTESGDDDIKLKLPPPCGGTLSVGDDGRLRCEQDHGVQGLLDLMAELDSTAMRELTVPPGTQIHIGWDENLTGKMGEFRKFAGGNLLVATDLLRDAIGKGESAFTPEARIPGTNQHPLEFLRGIGMRVHVTPDTGIGARLQSILERQSNDPANNARIAKFRSDFGAMSLLSLATNKDFNKGLAYGLGASLIGTGAIGATFDYGVWRSVKNAMGAENAAKYGPLIDSLTPLFAETFDSMVIKRLMEVMKGGNFMPDDIAAALGDLKGAAFSGSIAAVGSIPNNFVRELAKAARDSGNTSLAIGLLVAKQFTNLLATWTSGAMVPLEVMEDHKALVDAKMSMIDAGAIPRPDVADVRKHVSDEALNTLRAARGTGSSIRSMATGGEIAATLGLTLSLLEHNGLISSSVEQLITLMYSTPTEVISMLSTMAAEKWVGADASEANARITTDAAKQSGMLAQISRSGSTTLADLDRGARPYGERNAQIGSAVTVALGTAMGLVEKGGELGAQYASTLGQGVQAWSGAAYEHALKPVGQGIAWTAQRTAETVGPILAPVGGAAMAAASAAGTYALQPTANATAMAFDGIVRAPGAGAKLVSQAVSSGTELAMNLAKSRHRRQDNEPTGDEMV